MLTPTKANELPNLDEPTYFITGREDGRYGRIAYGALPGIDEAVTQTEEFARQAEESAARVDLGALDDAVEQSGQNAASAATSETAAAGSAAQAQAALEAAIEAGAWTYKNVPTPADLATVSPPPVAGNTALVLNPMHQWYFNGTAWVDTGESPLAGKAEKSVTDPVTNRFYFAIPSTSGFIFALLNAAKTKVLFGITKSGNIVNAAFTALKSRVSALERLLSSTRAALYPAEGYVCVGDSLSEGAGSTSATFTYPRQLQTMFNNEIPVANRGIGSQTGEQIAARAGGLTTTLTVSGNEIPASGSFSCTAVSPDICYGAAVSRSVDGWIEHVTGFERVTLTRNGGTGLYTATRTTAGSALPTRAGARFIPDLNVGAPVVRSRAMILWPDRNTNMTLAGASAEAIAMIEQTIAALPTGMKHYLVMDRLNNALEPVGSAAHTACVAHNLALAKRFSVFCIPIRSILIQQGLRMRGITPTAQDLIDIANDIIPSSLRADSTHLNNDGYWVVARAVYLHIQMLERAGQWL